MAGTKVRGITIELSADASGINSALKDVNKSIASTSRELRDIDKLLKLDPTNVTLLAQKQEALQRAMTQTRDKVDLLKKAEEDLKKQMVDGGTEEQKKQLAALEREIISSEKNLEKYTDQMNQAGKETDQLAKSEREAEQATSSMSGGFTVLKGALASLAADGIRMAADALKDLITEGPKYADEILTMAQKTHVATDTLQELDYMSGLVDVDVSTVAKSMQKLTKNMASAQKGSGTAFDAFTKLGVSFQDANGKLRDSEDVFFDVIEAMGKIENEADRDATGMNIFGKSATELNPLIEAGSDALREYADEAKEMGYVLDDDALKALSRVQDAFDRFDRQMVSVKNTIAAGLAPAVERGMNKIQSVIRKINWERVGQSIGDAFEGIIDAFEWILEHGNEIKAILAGIIAAFAAQKIAGIVQSIGAMTKALTAMNVAASANPYVLLFEALAALVAGLAVWTKDLGDAYRAETELGKYTAELTAQFEENKAATDLLVDAYDQMDSTRTNAISSAQSEASYLQDLTDELDTLVDKNGEVKEADQARAEFILQTLNGALGTEYDMTDLLTGKYQEMTESVYKLIEAKRVDAILSAQEAGYTEAVSNRENAEAQLAATTQTLIKLQQDRATAEAYLEELQEGNFWKMDARKDGEIQRTQEQIAEIDEQTAKFEENYAAQAELVNKYLFDIEQYEANWQAAHDKNYSAIETKSYETVKSIGGATKDYATEVANNTKEASNTWLQSMSKMVTEATGKQVEFKDAGKGMVKAIVDGVEQDQLLPASQVRTMGLEMIQKSNDITQHMYASAKNIDPAIAQAIAEGAGPVYEAVRQLAAGIVTEFNKDMKINSPAKVMIPGGKSVVEGVAVGIAQGEQLALNQMDRLSANMVDRFNPVVSGYAGITSVAAAGNGSVSNSFVQNNYSPKALSRLEIYRQTQNLLSYAGRA